MHNPQVPGPMPQLREDAPLAPLTTLELGGRARYLTEVDDPATAHEALRWADAQGVDVAVIGGGSNLVVADAGFPGLVLRMASRGVQVERGSEWVRLTVAAGEPWDEVVEMAVAEGWAGVECLSGIPGSSGATPIQNVGAYGQEVADVVESVRVLDRSKLAERQLTPVECDFSYRTSRFRAEPGCFVVLAVTLRLRPGAAPTLRYPELVRALGVRAASPSLAEVRAVVLEVRRGKSMVLDPDDSNRRSVGSFFTNPVLEQAQAETVIARAVQCGVVTTAEEVPRFAGADGRIKIPAAWLIEAAGFAKGLRRGAVGISSRHTLALVHHGGGTTSELLALAAAIRGGVQHRFGVLLQLEPAFLGFAASDPLGAAV